MGAFPLRRRRLCRGPSQLRIETVGSILSIGRAEALREGGQRARLNDWIAFYGEPGALERRPYLADLLFAILAAD